MDEDDRRSPGIPKARHLLAPPLSRAAAYIAERFFRERGDHDPYVSNASIKGALIEAGYEPVWDDPINMGFRVGPRPGSDWAEKPHGPRVSWPSLLHTPHPIPEYPASRERRQHHRRNV